MSITIRTVFQPTVPVTVSDAEYAGLLKRGLVYAVDTGQPIDVPTNGALMTVNIRTTMDPSTVITVSDVEFASLFQQHLVYSIEGGTPVDYPDFTPSQYADLLTRFVSNAYQPSPNGFSGLKGLLNSGQSVALGVGSDSTGGGITRWPYLFAKWLIGRYPGYSLAFRPYSSVNLDWAPRIVLGAPDTRQIAFNGTTVTGLMEGSKGTAFSNITGDIDLRVKIAPTKWSGGAAQQTILAKFGGAGARAYRFQLMSTGTLQFLWTPQGGAEIGAISTVSNTFVDGTVHWVRVVLDVDNGSSGNTTTFYTSEDGQTWTQLGTPVVRAGVTSITSVPDQPVELAARSNGQAELFAGAFYEIEVRNGINGAISCPVRPSQWQESTGNYDAVTTGPATIDIWDGFWSGGALTGQLIPNQATMVPAVGMSAWILNNSHNEVGRASASMWAQYDAFVNYARSANPAAGILVSTQNPDTPPVPQRTIDGHAIRNRMLASFAAQRGYTLIPAYDAFLSSPIGMATLNSTDGIHPSDSDGSPLWASVVADTFVAAM